jgi:hypothetical protein
MTSLCQNKDLGLSCFGCCGNNYTTRKDVLRDIRINTLRFEKYKERFDLPAQKEAFFGFLNAVSSDIRQSGVCKLLVYLDKKRRLVGCPLHPGQNNGKDFRDNHCEKYHQCKANFLFTKWPKQKQKLFIQFLKDKNLDFYEYSIRLDNDQLINEFLKK